MKNSESNNIHYRKFQGIESVKHYTYHNLNELYYMAKGSTTYYIGNKVFLIHEGDWVFIPSGTFHKTE